VLKPEEKLTHGNMVELQAVLSGLKVLEGKLKKDLRSKLHGLQFSRFHRPLRSFSQVKIGDFVVPVGPKNRWFAYELHNRLDLKRWNRSMRIATEGGSTGTRKVRVVFSKGEENEPDARVTWLIERLMTGADSKPESKDVAKALKTVEFEGK
jgi:hypothetical protein